MWNDIENLGDKKSFIHTYIKVKRVNTKAVENHTDYPHLIIFIVDKFIS